jgi:hypothetical protein
MRLIVLFFILLSFNASSQQTIDKLNANQLKLPKENISRALILDPAGQVKSSSSISDTELSYLDGLTDTIVNLLTGKEPSIASGTTLQYWRGDKSWQTLDKSAVGLSNVDNTSDANKPISTATQTALNSKENSITAGTTGQYWRGDKSFQTLDKSSVGLSNVDNTSDVNKPISSATQTALNGKYDASNPSNYVNASGAAAAAPVQSVSGKSGIITLDKTDVGLPNVDNTSDLNKPISTDTQTALNGKENSITAGTTSQYYRGDKTFQTLDKSSVGLSNVDNTSDADKPISSATQTALNDKANKDLSNIVSTSIPASTSLESLDTNQTLGSGFRIVTKDQTSSVSGRIAVASGTVAGNFVSGPSSISSGNNTSASMATPATAATGSASLVSGSITGGTQGSTGSVAVQSGTVPAGIAGSSGSVQVVSGNNSGTGNTGVLALQTGAVVSGATGNTGSVLVNSGQNSGTGSSGNISMSTGTSTTAASGTISTGTGKSVNAASGAMSFTTGAINSTGTNNALTGTATGNITINSGDIGTGASTSTAVTGNLNLRSGNTIGLGVSGNVNINSGASTNTSSTANTGTLNMNSGAHSGLGASGNLNIGTGNTSNASNTASSGQIFIVSGSGAGTGATGDANLKSGNRTGTGSGASGIALVASGDITNAAATGASGFAQISSGNQAGLGASGNSNLGTGSITNVSSAAQTGNVSIFTGQTSGTGNSGNVNISTGTVTTGVRGIVNINAQAITVNNSKIENLATPTSAQDATTKDYVDSQITAQTDFHKESVALTATDITNQYLDLSIVAVDESCQIGKFNRLMIWQGFDYTISKTGGVGGKTRISFIGPSATAGADALVAGNTLYIQCVID